MGDHRSNITAIAAKTFPAFPPAGHDAGLRLIHDVVGKPNVFLVPPGEPLSVVDLNDHAEWCKQNGVAQDVHTLGEPLPPEKCDVVFRYAGVYANISEKRIGMFLLPGELVRIDLLSFLAMGEKALESQSRIVAPASNLSVVR